MAAGNSPGVFGFDPRSVPGMALWLDAADASSLTFSSGSNVSTWKDKSGNGNNATAFNSPLLVSGAVNGQSVLRLNGTTQYFNLGNVLNLGTNPLSMFVVTKFDPGSGEVGIVGKTSYRDFAGRWALWYGVSNVGAISTGVQSVLQDSVVPRVVATGNPNQYSIWCFTTNRTSSVSLLQNGITSATSNFTATAGNLSTTDNLMIGAYPDSTGTAPRAGMYMNGDICETLVYFSDLTTSQRQQIEGYLAHKWGLNTALTGGLTKPTQIPGCALWLDAADASTISFSSGSNVSTWNDKSGNNRHVTQATSANQPLYNLGSRRIECTLSNMTLQNTANMSLNHTATLIVVSGTFDTVTNSRMVEIQQTGTSPNGTQIIVENRASSSVRMFFLGPNSTRYGEFTRSGLTSIATVQRNGTANLPQGCVDGGVLTTLGLIDANYTVPDAVIIGRNAVGYVQEIIIFNTALTTSQRQSVEGYLATKWGLRASLPATHPTYTGIAAQPFAITRPFTRGFQPVDIPGCALWLDAADASSLTFSSGSNVSVWKDKSGNGNNATAAGTAPTLLSNAVVFGGAGYFATGVSAASSNESVFVVAKYSSSGNAEQGLVGQTANGGRFIYVQQSDSSLQIGSYGVASGSAGPTNRTPANTTFIGEAITTSGSQIVYTNGANPGTTVSVTYTAGATTVLGVGFIGGAPRSAQYLLGSMNEVLIFNVALTTSQRQQIEGYLAWKWGLNAQLPGVPLNPLWQSGLALWLDAADSSTITGTSPVTAWADKSGNGLNVTKNASYNGPTYNATGLNSRPTLSFSTALLQTSAVNPSTAFTTSGTDSTIFLVVNITGDGVNYGAPYGLATTADTYTLRTPWGNSDKIWDCATAYTARLTYSSITRNGVCIISLVRSGTNMTMLFNGVSVATTTTASGTITTTSQSLNIGADTLVGTNWFQTGISEFIIFKTGLNTSQRQGVETYLARKWGLTVPTSTPHPFFRLPASSPLPFSPLGISGCALWLDAADQSTVTGTTSMTLWRDKSSNAYAAISFVNSVANPSWVSNIRNGNGVIQYSAGNGSAISNFVLAQTMSIFMIYYPINQTTGFFIEQGPDENTNPGFYFYTLSGNNFAINSGTGQVAVNYAANVVISNTWQMIEGINQDPANSSTMAFYINGVTRASGATQSGTTPVTATLFLNGRNGTSNVSYNTYLAELIIYSNALNTTQRQSVEGYLANKWGLNGSLPTSHPYTKFGPPATPY